MDKTNDYTAKWVQWPASALIILTQAILLYFIPRSSFLLTYGAFLILFSLYFYIVRNSEYFSFRFCIGLAVILRLVAVFSIPELSDDYFRFIWDGQMVSHHINPFQFTPQDFLQTHHGNGYLAYLYAGMNSQEYHSVYPPVLQAIFYCSVLISPGNAYGSLLVMKLIILVAECMTMRILFLYAVKKEMPVRETLWYILNPMIIVELTGNVHFEAIMLCFTLCAFYLLEQKRWLFSAVCYALAIASKMIPLLFAPVLMRYLGFKKTVQYGAISVFCLAVVFLPFYNSHVFTDINTSLKLFYNLFEFNGSIFYFIRWVGYRWVHYDVIEETAPVLGVISFVLILLISSLRRGKFSLPEKSMWILFVYFLFATMVHPWYISGIVLFSVFSRYRFPLIFSLLIPLSYFPYSLKVYDENNWIILAEYGLLFVFIGFEYRKISRNFKPVL